MTSVRIRELQSTHMLIFRTKYDVHFTQIPSLLEAFF